MKKNIFRLSVLVLGFVMLLAMLCGCKNPNGSVDVGDSGNNTDGTTITQTTTIYDISKHGNLILYMYGSDLFDKGFELAPHDGKTSSKCVIKRTYIRLTKI